MKKNTCELKSFQKEVNDAGLTIYVACFSDLSKVTLEENEGECRSVFTYIPSKEDKDSYVYNLFFDKDFTSWTEDEIKNTMVAIAEEKAYNRGKVA